MDRPESTEEPEPEPARDPVASRLTAPVSEPVGFDLERAGIDRANFEALYESHVDAVFRYLSRRVGPDIAEELTAQTFTEAWRTRERFDPDRGSYLAWLYGIAVNLMRHHWRTERRRVSAYARSVNTRLPSSHEPIEEVGVDGRLSAAQRWPQVVAAFAELPDNDRDILTMATVEGMSYDQIAESLELPVGTVRSRLHRARARLSSMLPPSALDS